MDDRRLVWRFPMPQSELIDNAYWDLERSDIGTETEKRFLGDHNQLAKPWDVATCEDPDLRRDVWDWYDRVVSWFNHEYVWEPAAGMIPPCWPLHPHLVHEIGAIADQRRRIEMATNANPLEEWHRYAIPTFQERLQMRVRQHCDELHQPWPARSRIARHVAPSSETSRRLAFKDDVDAVTGSEHDSQHRGS